MTALEAVAQREATVAYHSARQVHERLAITEYRAGHIAAAAQHAQEARRLARFAPSETLVIARIDGNEPRDGMWR